MHENRISSDSFSSDILEFLRLLNKHQVKNLVVGGQAVIYYGYARFTGDIDIFYQLEKKNIEKLYNALSEFWLGNIPGLKSPDELGKKGRIIQFGIPPNRIDLINQIDGVAFDDAWSNKLPVSIEYKNFQLKMNLIGLSDLIRNKAEAKRSKDLDDLRYLRHIT